MQQEEEERARVRCGGSRNSSDRAGRSTTWQKGRGDTDLLWRMLAARIMELYRQRIDGVRRPGGRALARRIDEIERKLRLAGLRAERTNSRIAAVPQALGRDSPQTRQGNRSAGGAASERDEKQSVAKLRQPLIVFESWVVPVCTRRARHLHHRHLLLQ